MEAPICIAKGIDEIAMRIRETAKEHDIVIYEAPPLARVLYDTIEIDDIYLATFRQCQELFLCICRDFLRLVQLLSLIIGSIQVLLR